jgi:hypothetical protein
MTVGARAQCGNGTEPWRQHHHHRSRPGESRPGTEPRTDRAVCGPFNDLPSGYQPGLGNQSTENRQNPGQFSLLQKYPVVRDVELVMLAFRDVGNRLSVRQRARERTARTRECTSSSRPAPASAKFLGSRIVHPLPLPLDTKSE